MPSDTEAGPSTSERNRWVHGVAKQLREGEEVEIRAGGKERTLTVTRTARFVERRQYRCNALLVDFEGYGTEYTLEVPEDDDQPPVLHYPSGNNLGEVVRDIESKESEQFGLVAEKTAADMGIPER